MLEQFQKAFGDLAASPAFVSQVMEDPAVLRERYDITDREWRRLVSVVNQPGMKCNCMLYRANRLTPVAAYLPELCEALGADLNPFLAEYWEQFTHTNLNFLVEAYRFCQFVQNKIDARIEESPLSAEIFRPVLKREMAGLAVQLKEMFGDSDVNTGDASLKDISVLFAGAGVKMDLNDFCEAVAATTN